MAAAEFQESLKKILEGSLDPIIAAPIWFIAGALPGPARTGVAFTYWTDPVFDFVTSTPSDRSPTMVTRN